MGGVVEVVSQSGSSSLFMWELYPKILNSLSNPFSKENRGSLIESQEVKSRSDFLLPFQHDLARKTLKQNQKKVNFHFEDYGIPLHKQYSFINPSVKILRLTRGKNSIALTKIRDKEKKKKKIVQTCKSIRVLKISVPI